MNGKFLKHLLARASVVAVLTWLILASGYVPIANAATFVVNGTEDAVDASPGDGVCATASGVCTLRAAISEANALPGADVINLPAGMYRLTISWWAEDANLGGDLDITDDLTINGADATTTIIDASAGDDRVIDLLRLDITVNISRVTIQGGHARWEHGGGISALGAGNTLFLSNTIITNNYGDFGGGILTGGTLNVDNSSIIGNHATIGGGGVYLFNSAKATINTTTIMGNTTGEYGGGIGNTGNTVLTNSTISGNMAGNGGGLFDDGSAKIVNSTISGNSASDNGGGILFSRDFVSSAVDLNNVTITGNTADSDTNGTGDGGGIYGPINLSNTIIAGNTDKGNEAPDCSGNLNSQGYNVIQVTTGCTIAGNTKGNLIGVNPNLGPLQNNGGTTLTHGLVPVSPAINSGNPALPGSGIYACLATDQRGITRPQGVRCDIGAFENQAALPTIIIASPQAKDYLHTSTFKFTWSAIDIESGIASESGTLDGSPVTKDQIIDLFLLRLGVHTVQVTATDNAGNTANASVPFTVMANIDSLIAAKERICTLGWINSADVCKGLDDKLNAAKVAIGRGQNDVAKNQLNAFINQLDAQKGKAVNQQAYDLLKTDALYVIAHLP